MFDYCQAQHSRSPTPADYSSGLKFCENSRQRKAYALKSLKIMNISKMAYKIAERVRKSHKKCEDWHVIANKNWKYALSLCKKHTALPKIA